jgi:hypothetical protein
MGKSLIDKNSGLPRLSDTGATMRVNLADTDGQLSTLLKVSLQIDSGSVGTLVEKAKGVIIARGCAGGYRNCRT